MRSHRLAGRVAAVALCLGALGAGAATFGEDAEFLREHTDAFVLGTGDSRIAVVPAYQGRVMTSTAQGDDGLSLGWINRELVASGEIEPHINAYGGEDRFWLGPEGGQFGIYFPPGAEFIFDTWQTPAPIDTEPFPLVEKGDDRALFRRVFDVTNWSGTKFSVEVEREVRLLDAAAVGEILGAPLPEGVKAVAFETRNKLTNRGDAAWEKDTGLLSIWILGMFTPTPQMTVVIPFQSGSESERGPKVTSDYFGPIPAERLKVEDDVLYFKADGNYRSKLGISPARSRGVAGSYDAENRVLTLVTYNVPEKHEGYVNSTWKMQDDPFAGDAINSYNDGPLGPGQGQMGPFYELETSSPALALAPGESYEHVHRTLHLVGPEEALDPVAQKVLGADLETVKTALP